jgi:starch phosphorylase
MDLDNREFSAALRPLPSWLVPRVAAAHAVDCCIPDAEIWKAHVQAKGRLIERVQALAKVTLQADIPILGFARRMTAYKRPDLLFTDLERLKAIARKQPLQIVLAGKAHPGDENGKRLIEQLHRDAQSLAGTITVVYLPGYDMTLAQTLTAGVDIWLNTPLPPFEASGTSGMKATFNGVPNLSVLDGWWIEGCIEGVTGWSIGSPGGAEVDNARSLYEKLENVVLPLYFNSDRSGWINVMKGAIGKNASYFNSHRMMRRYATEAYIL